MSQYCACKAPAGLRARAHQQLITTYKHTETCTTPASNSTNVSTTTENLNKSPTSYTSMDPVTSDFEYALTRHEPFCSLLIRYLQIHEFISLARTNRALRGFIFSHSGIWRDFDVRPFIPEDVNCDGPTPGVLHDPVLSWGELMGIYKRKPSPSQPDHWSISGRSRGRPRCLPRSVPRLHVPYHSEEMTTGFLDSIFGNLKRGINVVRLNLDGMPVTRRPLFDIAKDLKGTLEVLSLRFCSELNGDDFIDLLRPPTLEEEEQGIVFLPRLEKLKRLYVTGTPMSYAVLTRNTQTNNEAPIKKVQALCAARKISCDVRTCSKCTQGFSMRSSAKCPRCKSEDESDFCYECYTRPNPCLGCSLPYCKPCSFAAGAFAIWLTLGENRGYGEHSSGWVCKKCVSQKFNITACLKCSKKIITSNDDTTGKILSNSDTCYGCQGRYCLDCVTFERSFQTCSSCRNWMCDKCLEQPKYNTPTDTWYTSIDSSSDWYTTDSDPDSVDMSPSLPPSISLARLSSPVGEDEVPCKLLKTVDDSPRQTEDRVQDVQETHSEPTGANTVNPRNFVEFCSECQQSSCDECLPWSTHEEADIIYIAHRGDRWDLCEKCGQWKQKHSSEHNSDTDGEDWEWKSHRSHSSVGSSDPMDL